MEWRRTVWTLLVLCVAASPSLAVTHFVYGGASGSNNGTSWANAWTTLSGINWSSLTAGDVVCVAGGTYTSGITTGKSGTAGNSITIRRATASDATCGSSTSGWNSAFDAQVNMGSNTITIQNSYITIDGAVPSGIYGTVANGGGSWLGVAAATSNVTIRYIEMSGPCPPAGCDQNSDSRAVNLDDYSSGSYLAQTDWDLYGLNMHGFCTPVISYNAPGLIIEHCRFADSIDNTSGNPNCHPNTYEDGGGSGQTFRYNEITNWQVEGIMTCPNGGCTTDIAIYGNIWHDPYAGSYPRFLEAQGNSNGPYLVYNNTFVNMYYECAGTANGGSFASGTIGYNNLYYGNDFTTCGLPSEDYAASNGTTGETNGQNGLTSSIFTNYSAKTVAGYNLSEHTNAGLNLGSPYNIDYAGNTRVTWDRGAYEFVKPSPATNLTATPH